MRILLVNKFLYPKGGAETYVINLGEYLESQGHEVQYFGLLHEENTLHNDQDLYVKYKELSKNNIESALQIFSLIYNQEAKKKMALLLDKFNPDLIILNNIEYHLTPSIILAVKDYKKKNEQAKLYYVAHDYQIVCPSHGLFDSDINYCEKCLNGSYWSCFKTKCFKKSRVKSLIGTLDSSYWHKKGVYSVVDKIICPSYFLKSRLDTCSEIKDKTVAIHNFVNLERQQPPAKNGEKYALYFGAFTVDKGVSTILKVAKRNPDIKFVFAGYGPLEESIIEHQKKYSNIEFVGFKKGKELRDIIENASFTLCASEWCENCPFSVIEAQMYYTPVIGSNIGGIPELIQVGKTGELFEAGNDKELEEKIRYLYDNDDILKQYSNNCKDIDIETIESYTKKLLEDFDK